MDRQERWALCAIACAATAFCLLLIEHFLPHGPRLWPPQHHWLSEYVLSASPAGRKMMLAAFVLLGSAALSTAAMFRHRLSRLAFGLAGSGLAAMAFFDSDPNDARPLRMLWPPTHGNVHQMLLYLAMAAAIGGMALRTLGIDGRRYRRKAERALLAITIAATLTQMGLVAVQRDHMTLFGGVTERIVVVSMLAWVILAALAQKRDIRRSGPSPVQESRPDAQSPSALESFPPDSRAG